LVFITEMKSVYSAVRTGSLNKALRLQRVNILKFYGHTAHIAVMCCVWISEFCHLFYVGVELGRSH
jgi:hypothetical protein